MKEDDYRMSRDLAVLRVATDALMEIYDDKESTMLREDFEDALSKLCFLRDVLHELVLEALVEEKGGQYRPPRERRNESA